MTEYYMIDHGSVLASVEHADTVFSDGAMLWDGAWIPILALDVVFEGRPLTTAEQTRFGPELKGGPTSGNFGHAGRPGDVGGSSSSGGTVQGTASREASEAAVSSAREYGGVTMFVSGKGFRSPTEGYVVSTNPERSKKIENYMQGQVEEEKQQFRSYVTKNSDLLKSTKYGAGIWVDKSTGTGWHDVVRVVADKGEAIRLGKEHNQIAIYGIAEGEEISTGGTGE